MKSLIVYEAGGKWFGSEVSWDRAGSGYYRQTRGIEIPQTRAEIEALAQEFGYSIEWRGTPAAEDPADSGPGHPHPRDGCGPDLTPNSISIHAALPEPTANADYADFAEGRFWADSEENLRNLRHRRSPKALG